jgi:hypothetical protein
MTYSANGCDITATVTVNPLPIAIRNNAPLCPGTSVTLSSTSGGTWASSNTVLASINSATGLMTAGASAGNPVITYTLPTTCRVTAVATVTSTPSSIVGAASVAVGVATSYSDATPGGTWSSSNTTVATVNSAGLVNGVSVGTANIVYTTSGCGFVSKTISVTARKDANAEGIDGSAITVSDLHVIPNPNKGVFVIKGTLGITTDDEVSIEITDMLGQSVYKNKVLVTGGNMDQKIQLSNVANGMYLLSIHSSVSSDVYHIVVEQ